MSFSDRARPAARHTRSTVLAALVIVGAALLGALVSQSLASSSFPTTSPVDMLLGDPVPTPAGVEPRPPAPERPGRPRPGSSLGEADGAVPDGVTVFDDGYPAVANLDPGLLGALRRAATDAAGDGVEVYVDSGWRSPQYQEHLLHEAVLEYGSAKEAARWVATLDTSRHVSGEAVDIGRSDATAWLSKHGAEYGLCQIYRNEPWHYELRPKAVDRGCPSMYADPTHDPRMTK